MKTFLEWLEWTGLSFPDTATNDGLGCRSKYTANNNRTEENPGGEHPEPAVLFGFKDKRMSAKKMKKK
jgi:hypothetical protein